LPVAGLGQATWDAKGEVLSVRYEQINAMLLNEFLKEHRTVEEQNVEIETLKQRLDKLEQLIARKTGGQP
jgi:polyhydroxyalkanoate synthesis regulator phasin